MKIFTGTFTKTSSRGFTLIEMMVAVALFAVVMVIAVTSLIAVVGASRRAQAVQAVMDNLGFALDDMSRTIRTGTNYHCGSGTPLTNTNDCSSTSNTEVAVLSSSGDTVVYEFLSSAAACGTGFVGGCIEKSTDGGVTFLPITSPEINIDNLAFYVMGSCSKTVSPADTVQPRVTMILRGYIDYQNKKVAEIKLETNITQRLYDN